MYLDQYDPLPRKYLEDMISDSNFEFDHKYGVRHDILTDKLFIGNSQIHIKGSDVVVKNKTYSGTPGLYELLFKKDPQRFTNDDEKAYTDILLKTSAHKRYYQENKQIDGSRSKKYTKIIAPFIKKGGGLFIEVNKKEIDPWYWNDPNELVHRLRLILASQEAGNSNHTNEIVRIIEELREADIIV